MRGFVRFTLGQTVFLNLVFALCIVAGVFSFLTLPTERYPQVNFGEAYITTYYRGANPTEVETLVTREIEDAIEGLEDVEWVQATSYRERSMVRVKFVDDIDYEARFDEMRFKVLSAQSELPADADPPRFNLIETSDWLPVVAVNLVGDRGNRALTLMAKEMKTPLAQIPGVRDVALSGEYQREFHVVLDPDRMARYGVTFDDVATALRAANISIPAGDFTDTSGDFVVTVDETFRSREAVVDTIIRRDLDGSFVRVADVVDEAGVAYRDPVVISSVNGRDALTLLVTKTEDANALDIKASVEEVVASFAPMLQREHVEVVYTRDSTAYIHDAMSTLGWNLLAGMALVMGVIWVFMGLRNACLTTVGIPFSFLVTMIIMWATGNSLNEITLFAFVLVSGIIVDDAIVVVENIYRHVQEGLPLREAVVNGTAEVFWPVVSATSTTIAAFLPMLIMTGSTGEFFALIPKAVSFALAASLFECMLLVPIHYMDYGARPTAGALPQHEADTAVLRLIRRGVEWLVNLTMRHRVATVLTILGLFAASMAVLVLSLSGRAQLIRIKFFPDDYRLYYVSLEAPVSTPLEEVSARLKDIAVFLMADGPGMAESASGYAGFFTDEDYREIHGNNLGQVIVNLPVRDDRHFADAPANDPATHLEWIRARVKERFEKDGLRIHVRAEKDGPPTGKAINVRASGPNPASVLALAAEMDRFLRADPELGPALVDLEDDQGRPGRVYRFRVRRQRAAEFGLTPTRVAGLAAGVLDGRYIGTYRLPDEEVDLKVRITQRVLDAPGAALGVPLVEHASGPVRLGDVTRVETYMEPGYLNRYRGNRAVTLTANLAPGSQVTTPRVVARVKAHYEQVRQRYPGAGITFGGEHEDTQRSYTSLTYAFIIAVLLIYLILATQFRSYGQPCIILSAVVFSLIGVIVGKVVTQSLFTINSFIAVVGVTGVVVNDSLVLLDFINRAYRSGLSRRAAIDAGIRTRLRPILLTTLTTTLGLLPLAVGFPYYSLVWGTMASTFVTGLCTATALTLFVVPVLWDLLEAVRLRVGRSERAKGAVADQGGEGG
ncbi:MAG: efflux RND transporter permease subunit [Desulfovibrionaceae bacterium]